MELKPDPNCRWCHGNGTVRDVIRVNTGGVHTFRGRCHCAMNRNKEAITQVYRDRYEEHLRFNENAKQIMERMKA